MAKKGRARNGTGSLRFRTDRECWEIRYSVPDPLTGKSKRRSEYFKTRQDAERALLDRAHAVADKSFSEPHKMTLAAWLDEYFKEFANLQPSTMQTYRTLLARHVLPAIGHVRICDLNRERIQRLANQLYRNGLAASSVKTTIAILSGALHHAKRFGYIRENCAEDIEYPAEDRREAPAVTDAQQAALERAAGVSPIGDILFLAFRTGQRKSELLGMTWDAIDFDRAALTVYQLSKPLPGSPAAIKKPKNKKTRIVPLTSEVLERLRDIRKRQRQARLRAGSAWQNEMGLVFTNEIGAPLTQSAVDCMFRRIRKAAGLPEAVTLHSLRRAFATNLERRGVNPKAMAAIMGHYDASFTRDTYERFTDDMQRETLARMEQNA